MDERQTIYTEAEEKRMIERETNFCKIVINKNVVNSLLLITTSS